MTYDVILAPGCVTLGRTTVDCLSYARPWVNPVREEGKHRLELRFSIVSDCEIPEVSLALEEPEKVGLVWNGKQVSPEITGWYADRDIKTVFLGKLWEGLNCLELSLPYDEAFQVENCYLLGDFGVLVAGKTVRVIPPVKELAFGDFCVQGLPFYGGNLIYQMEIETGPAERGKKAEIQISKFRCPLLRCSVDGEDRGVIAFSPYRLDLGCLEPGRHMVEILVYGNRVNTFGPVHNCNQTELWIGPDAWRSEGVSWADEYQLKPSGILAGPRVWL